MRVTRLLFAGSLIVASAAVIANVSDQPSTSLRAPSDFAAIPNPKARSIAMFVEMGKVIEHPRCMNCHPRNDTPTQGDAMVPHTPPVTRGPEGHGVPAMQCKTCHGDANVAFAGSKGSIPGDPHWHLAPKEMGWQGMTLGQICRQIKDPKRNGGRDAAALFAHNRDDHLVGWAWHPGPGRTPAPGSQAIFAALTKAWLDTGAHCPK